MSGRRYDQFFTAATHHEKPFVYQCRLACGDDANLDSPQTLATGRKCESLLINVPTGLGKTLAVVLAWLWNRVQLQDPEWPRRLVYCLPMRTLVEQTRDNVKEWLNRLAETYPDNHELRWLSEHSPVVLMGGEEAEDWDLYPERAAIIVGTQDMLLSRALNRGYAMSRYRWPMHFGLLNNDCLWVMDEVQLMGPGVASASQLEAFRRAPAGVDGPRGLASFFDSRSATWYASATTSLEMLKTREWRKVSRPDHFVVSLTDIERAASPIIRRRSALKKLDMHQDWDFGKGQPPSERVTEIVGHHERMVNELRQCGAPRKVCRRSLVLCNNVDRALDVYESLRLRQQSGQLQDVDLVLLHSRFRPPDRITQMARLQLGNLERYMNGQIVVATQVIEAGVDISSAVLWTEIAPLASLVQRFGRLNRCGEFGSNGQADYGWNPQTIVLGIDLPPVPAKEKVEEQEKREKETARRYLPYAKEWCDNAWEVLPLLEGDACPAALERIQGAIAASIEICLYSLQRHELLDFFDTDSNLSLGYTDVSPFVRGLDVDTDVYVLWRKWEGDPNGHFNGDIGRDELCAVPVSRVREFTKWREGWLWLGKERGWASARTQGVFPGAILLLPIDAGGYASCVGWTGDEGSEVDDLYKPAEQPSDEDMLSCLTNGWRSIPAHTEDVRVALNTILRALVPNCDLDEMEGVWREVVDWHDIGKNHRAWQDAVAQALKDAGVELHTNHQPFAKFSLSESPRLRNQKGELLTGGRLRREVYSLKRLFRPGVAHEVASALALRQWHVQTASELRSFTPQTKGNYLAQLLAEYLVMSHHGRVRKVLRDEIPKKSPSEAKSAETVRGLYEGDPLPDVTINSRVLGCEALSVNCRQIGRDVNGRESYTRGTLRLLDHYGPFRLAYLEAIFRAADARGSNMAVETPPECDEAMQTQERS